MSTKLYNTLTKKIEDFNPIKTESVRMYTCGPTVYNYPHIGNYRAYIFSDILKRFLFYRGYKVKHVMNITDIDDKTIHDSQNNGKSLKEFTSFYTEGFFKDRDILNIIPADYYPRATDYIKEMLEMIEILIEKGIAYKGEDNSIYFDIKKDKDYGKLSNLDTSKLKQNAKGRLSSDEYEKENAFDFALWKAYDSKDGDVFWIPEEILNKKTSIEKGRPGWHIECSAMSNSLLGKTFDIHTGGVDNIFPHHENEIAQSECANGEKFANYFLHNEHLLVDGQKMSKSLGNFYTLQDLINKNIDPIAFRYWVYTSQYGNKTNFTIEAVKGCEVALNRLRDFYLEIKKEETGKISTDYKKRITEAMNNNLDTPKAIAILWDLIKDPKLPKSDKKATLLDFDNIFGFNLDNFEKNKILIPEDVIILAKERETARKSKEWAKSDELRNKILEKGFEIKDTSDSFEITPKLN